MNPRWYEIEMERLDADLAEGLVTPDQYRAAVREFNDDLRGQAEEAAERAYNDVYDSGW